jgi:SPP1 gp7 family putative phage head morphogenesis protein
MATKPTKPVTAAPVYPNAGVTAWYRSLLQELIRTMSQDLLDEVTKAWKDGAPLATDARAPTVFAAGVCFRYGERFLLVRRSDDMGWGWPGGGIENGETPEVACRREVEEELGFRYGETLKFSHIQRWKDVAFVTYYADPSDMFSPALNAEHTAFRWVTFNEALDMPLHPGVRATLLGDIAQDAKRRKPSRSKLLRTALERWGGLWSNRFDNMALSIATDFATRNRKATDASMRKTLADAGFTVKFKPTAASVDAFEAVIAENVGLIRTIPQKYLSDVQVVVWQGVMDGSDLRTMSKEIREKYGVAHRRAALIASDQNHKAKAAMERARRKEAGITEAIWQHSGGGVEPRETHLKMDEKRYNVEEGMYDSAVEKQIWPGTEINCRCTDRAVVPGF